MSILGAFPDRPLSLTRGASAGVRGCQPVFIEVLSIGKTVAGDWLLGFSNQLTQKPDCFVFDAETDPFLAGGVGEHGTESTYVAALLSEDGRVFALDAALTYVDLTDEERRSVRAAAGFK